MSDIAYEGVSKKLDETIFTVSGFSLHAGNGELIVLLGPEHSGNSEILRMTAGLEEPDGGSIRINGEEITARPARERGIAFLGPDAALYPNMTVYENIGFRLKAQGLPREELRGKILAAMALTETQALSQKKAHTLSPEQKYAVLLARALADGPGMLLLDHPAQNIPREFRSAFETLLGRVHQKAGILFLYATDDPCEASRLGGRIAVLKEGVLQQVGRAPELYTAPENTFVAAYFGKPAINLFEGRMVVRSEHIAIRLGSGRSGCSFVLPRTTPGEESQPEVSREVIVGIRPEHLTEVEASDEEALENPTVIRCKLQPGKGLRETSYLRAEYSATEIYAKGLEKKEGERASNKVSLRFDTQKLHLFDRHTLRRLCCV